MIVKESEFECPVCKSYRTDQFRPAFVAASGILFVGIGAWIFSIPILGLIFVIIGCIMIAASPFLRNVHMCKTCKKIWKIKSVKKVSADKILDFMERSQKYRKEK